MFLMPINRENEMGQKIYKFYFKKFTKLVEKAQAMMHN